MLHHGPELYWYCTSYPGLLLWQNQCESADTTLGGWRPSRHLMCSAKQYQSLIENHHVWLILMAFWAREGVLRKQCVIHPCGQCQRRQLPRKEGNRAGSNFYKESGFQVWSHSLTNWSRYSDRWKSHQSFAMQWNHLTGHPQLSDWFLG